MVLVMPLFKEQWLILLLGALVLCLGLSWGMPSRKRVELLTYGFTRTPAQIKTHYSAMEPSADKETSREDEYVLSVWHKYQNFWDCVLYSSATDEWHTYGQLAAMKPAELDFRITRQVYGGAFIYAVGASLMLGKLAGIVHIVPDSLYYLTHPEEMARIQMTGRVLLAASYLGVLLLLALWGNRLGGRITGTAAMAAWLLSPMPFVLTLVTKPHVYAAFWGLWALYLLWRHLEAGGRGKLLASGACLGLAVGSSIVAGALALAWPVLLWDPKAPKDFVKSLGYSAMSGLAVFLLSNPYSILDFHGFISEISRHTNGVHGRFLSISVNSILDSLNKFFISGYALPVGILAIYGFHAAQIEEFNPTKRLALLGAFYLLIFTFILGISRVTLFLGPLICLFAGLALGRLTKLCPPSRKRALIILLCLLAAPGLFATGSKARDVIWDQGWYAPTKAWVSQANIGPQTSIGIIGSSITPNIYPPFPFLRAKVVNLRHYRSGKALPRFVVIDNTLKSLSLWIRNPLRKRYRLLQNLGYRKAWSLLDGWIYPSEARLAGWVFELKPRTVRLE
jgi:hypothetical protein